MNFGLEISKECPIINVGSVPLASKAEDVRAQVRRGRQLQAVGAFLDTFAVEGRPPLGAYRNIPLDVVRHQRIRFASHEEEEAVHPFARPVPEGDVHRLEAREASRDGQRVQRGALGSGGLHREQSMHIDRKGLPREHVGPKEASYPA